MRLAITGGFASGKSTVCHFFKKLGAYVVSADEIVHELLAKRIDVQKQVQDLLGSEVVILGRLDRKAIAEKVFSQTEALISLEQILHPLVLSEMRSQYTAVKDLPDYRFFVAEVPLLFESCNEEFLHFFDYVIAVTAPMPLCEERCIKKGLTQVQNRIQRQLPQKTKAERAQFVIENTGTLESLERDVLELAEKLQPLE